MARRKLPQEWTIINDYALSLITKRDGSNHIISISSEDVDLLGRYLWHICGRGYVWTAWAKSDGKVTSMHSIVLGKYPDHINKNPLDNRRDNLRECTRQQNQRNRKLSANCATKLKGVYKETNTRLRKPFCAKIGLNGKQKNLGRYATADEAAKAYDAAASELYGVFACTNRSLGLLD